jgi:hypothetical protein
MIEDVQRASLPARTAAAEDWCRTAAAADDEIEQADAIRSVQQWSTTEQRCSA